MKTTHFFPKMLWGIVFFCNFVAPYRYTIKVFRTLKPAVVRELTQLSDNKAYIISCRRGKLLTQDGYLASTAHSSLADAEPSTFAIITYEGNRYLYNIPEAKFVTNTGALEEMPTNGIFDAIQIETKDDWGVPYFMFYFIMDDGRDFGVNTNGHNPNEEGPCYGLVINDWMDVDDGNMYYMVAEADFDPTEAIAALDARYHTVVTYVVKDTEGKTLFTSDPVPAMKHDYISSLPTEFRRSFYTYNDADVTINDLETVVEFTATWNGPFEISTDYANAHWYDMAMRGTWYVTSAIKDDEGAYLTQDANTLGLVEESYHWAFLGNGYDGFKIINKAAGDGKSFGWTYENQKSQGIPTVMDDSEGYHKWKIVASTCSEVPANSFCLNVYNTDLYVNQYGGPGGSVKFWENTQNISDPGSAFTIIDIPDEFSEYVESDIKSALDATGYFTLTDAAKDAIGFIPDYLNYCSYANYKNMREKLDAIRGDLSYYILPETGYYTLTNKKYEERCLGIDPYNVNLYGYYYLNDNYGERVVKLTKIGNGTYKISVMGMYAPTDVVSGVPVTASSEEGAGIYTVSVPTFGYAAFQADTEDPYSALYLRSEYDIVGGKASEEASQWAVTNATSFRFTISDAGYATAYFPFPVSVPEGVTAYTGRVRVNKLWLVKQVGTIPAQTAVVLKDDIGYYRTYEFAITEDAAPVRFNDLKGTLEPINAVGKYVLAKPYTQTIAFYEAETGIIAAGKAYLDLPSDVKVFFMEFDDDATGIESLTPVLSNSDDAIYNVAGQRVNKVERGIYIINGKKVLK